MVEENKRLRRENAELRRVNDVTGGQRVFRGRDRLDPTDVMSFVDAHDFPVDLVLRVLGIAPLDVLRTGGPAGPRRADGNCRTLSCWR